MINIVLSPVLNPNFGGDDKTLFLQPINAFQNRLSSNFLILDIQKLNFGGDYVVIWYQLFSETGTYSEFVSLLFKLTKSGIKLKFRRGKSPKNYSKISLNGTKSLSLFSFFSSFFFFWWCRNLNRVPKPDFLARGVGIMELIFDLVRIQSSTIFSKNSSQSDLTRYTVTLTHYFI